jgi:hypothetical protein
MKIASSQQGYIRKEVPYRYLTPDDLKLQEHFCASARNLFFLIIFTHDMRLKLQALYLHPRSSQCCTIYERLWRHATPPARGGAALRDFT